MSLFRSFFGANGAAEEDNNVEIVEKLIERAETCTAIEDRRDALRALRSLAKKYRLQVGTMGMNIFVDILDKERTNPEILTIALETLIAILNSDDENTDEDELGERLAEIMLKKRQFLPALLSAVEQFEFSVRRCAVQLLTSLLRHRGPEVQNGVVAHPAGLSRLLDVVHDHREALRNEAILMLCELSRACSQIQQLLAYDNTFSILFDIVEREPVDSIVIEDCLFVVLNLLRKNHMNQQLFRENNLIARLHDILNYFLYGREDGQDTADWSKQRTANIIFLLQVIRSLVSPDNVGTNTHAAQKVIHHTKMLATLCSMLLSETGVSVEVLTESVIVVAESIRGNYTNQEYFASTNLITQDNLQRPSLLVLLISMTSEKQPFKLRCAVFYCFLSYLHENEFGKAKIVETLLPAAQADATFSTGALICQAMSSTESIQCWFGCVTLLHCLIDVEHLKTQLLRVQLSTSTDEPTMSLLEHVCASLLSMGNRRVQMRCALLMLLATWLSRCASAVEAFVANEDHLNYFTTQLVDESGEGSESEVQVVKGLMAYILLVAIDETSDESARKTLEQLVERRVGKENLVTLVDGVSRTEQFVRAQKPQPLAKTANELFLDCNFIRLFKSRESAVLKAVKSGDVGANCTNESIVQSFKDLIKRQDEEIGSLQQELKKATTEVERLQNNMADREKDTSELGRLKEELKTLRNANEQHKATELQFEELRRVNEQWRVEVERYKQWAWQWQNYQVAQIPNAQEGVIAQLSAQVQQLEQQLQYGYEAFESKSQAVISQATECAAWKSRAEAAEEKLAASTETANTANAGALQSETEDLLCLVAEQHNKLNAYRQRLRHMGQDVSDDDD